MAAYRGLLLAGLLLLGSGFRGCPSPSVVVLLWPEEVRVWELFESAAAVVHDAGNPFDPDQVEVWGNFVAPDGSNYAMPAFYTQEFERSLVGGFEKLAPASAPHWRLRFAPTQPGRWEWRWRVVTPEGTAESPWRSFAATASAGDRHGFLRVSPLDSRYLRFDDGTPYFAVGENLGWYDGRGTFAYDDWFAKLTARGVNFVRLWMPSWAFGIEWGQLGDYANRLDRAWQLDQVLEAAADHGIQVMLCLQNHGPFSTSNNSEWDSNPYNAANGGPLAVPDEFFGDDTAKAMFKRRLRYVVARWGWSSHVMAWELWNELNLVVDPDRADVVDWHREMAQELHALDPYDRLVTTSVSLGKEQTTLWQLPEIDLTQSHTYNWPLVLDHAALLETLNRRTRVAGKPSLIGEMGADYRGPAETLETDPSMIGFHDGVWIGVVSGTFGTGMTWWWDNLIDPLDLYPTFGAVAAFVAGLAFDEQGFVETRPPAVASPVPVERELDAWGLVGPDVALVWLKNRAHRFSPVGNPGDSTPVLDARVELSGLHDGSWLARWFDTRSGAELSRSEVVVSGGEGGAFRAPTFVGDVALRLERR